MKYRVLNHTSGRIEVHKVGCADVAKSKRMGKVNMDWLEELDPKDVRGGMVAAMNASFGWPYEGSDEPAPWSGDDIKVLPCTGSPDHG